MLVCALSALAVTPVHAENRFLADFDEEPYRAASDFFQLANPLVALGITLYKGDFQGSRQFAYNFAASTVTIEGLKRVFNHTSWGERPNGADGSFPSGHAGMACSAAAFVTDRYGWAYGLGLYATSAFTAYARVHDDFHHWRDVIGGCAISVGFSKLLTSRYEATPVQIEPALIDGTIGVRLLARFER